MKKDNNKIKYSVEKKNTRNYKFVSFQGKNKNVFP